jgi:hypothetical protein
MYKFQFKAVEQNNPHYNPEPLLDTLMRILGVRNDRQLAYRLSVNPPQICKVRKRRLSVAPSLLISMHEESGLSLLQLRALMGDYREHTGPSAKHPPLPQLQNLNGVQPQYGPQPRRRDGIRVAA